MQAAAAGGSGLHGARSTSSQPVAAWFVALLELQAAQPAPVATGSSCRQLPLARAGLHRSGCPLAGSGPLPPQAAPTRWRCGGATSRPLLGSLSGSLDTGSGRSRCHLSIARAPATTPRAPVEFAGHGCCLRVSVHDVRRSRPWSGRQARHPSSVGGRQCRVGVPARHSVVWRAYAVWWCRGRR